MVDVTVVGSSNTDMVAASKRLPRPGETVLGSGFYQAAGGKGANQAVAAARAGAKVAFIGCVGDDAMGVQARENLAREGIDVSALSTVEGAASGVALIFVNEKGENMISVAPGANAKLSPAMVEAARESIENANVVLLQLEIPLDAVERACDIAHGARVPVLLNPAPAHPLSLELLKKISVLIANEEEMAALDQEMDVERIIVTLGQDGGRVMERGRETWSYEPDRVEAKDTVGAGDCFCGWLAAGMAEGKELRACVETASKAAALSVTRRGAQPSLPCRDEVLS